MSEIITPIFPQYTNSKLTGALGSGLFDQLMEAVKEHLRKEFEGQRITANEYSTALVTSMGNVMQNTTQYLLGIALIEQQKAEIEARTALTEKQTEKTDNEMALIDLEREKLRFQIDQLYPLEVRKAEAEISNLEKQGDLIDKQIEKLDADIAHLLAQQSLWAKQEEKIIAEIAQLAAATALTLQQIDKVAAEITLLGSKNLTELANTVAGAAEDGSLIGRQKDLLYAQKLGFAGDIYMKSAKMHADYASVVMSVLEPDDPASQTLTGTTAATDANSAKAVAGNIS